MGGERWEDGGWKVRGSQKQAKLKPQKPLERRTIARFDLWKFTFFTFLIIPLSLEGALGEESSPGIRLGGVGGTGAGERLWDSGGTRETITLEGEWSRPRAGKGVGV